MDTIILEHFLALTRTLSYTKTAEELEKSESVISRQIARLEKETGLKLFEKTGRSIKLSPAGEKYAEGVIKLFQEYDSLLEESLAIQEGSKGILRIGIMTEQMLQPDTIDILNRFSAAYPNVFLQITSASTYDMIQKLMSNQVDIVFGAVLDFESLDNVETWRTSLADNHLVIPVTHPMADRDISQLSLYDFRDDTFLFNKEQEKCINVFSQLCRDFGFELKYSLVQPESALINLVQLSKGIAILDATHFFQGNRNMLLVPLPELGKLELGFIRSKANTNLCTLQFAQFLDSADVKQ